MKKWTAYLLYLLIAPNFLTYAQNLTPNMKMQTNTYTIHFDKEIELGNTSFRGADFKDGIALVSGSHGKIFKANANSQPLNWQKLSLPKNCDSLQFRDVAILNKATFLLMSAGEGASAQIWKSTNAGEQWNKVYQNFLEKAFFNSFDFWDDQRGLLISDPIDDHVYLLETKDAGNTWQRLQSDQLPMLIDKEYGFAASGTGIQCFGNGNIVVGTGGAVARIFHSMDYGKSWQVNKTPIVQGANSQGIFSVHFFNDDVGLAVGGDYANDQLAGSNVARFHKGGTWVGVSSTKNVLYKSCVKILNESFIIATGTSGTVISNDAGASWHDVDTIKGYHTIAYDENFQRGFLAGSEGRVLEFWVE